MSKLSNEELLDLTKQIHDMPTLKERNELVEKVAEEHDLSPDQLRVDIMEVQVKEDIPDVRQQ